VRIDTDTGEITVFDSTAAEAAFPSFSPDGRYVAYSGSLVPDAPIIVQSLDGADRKRVAEANGGEPVWSPDGNWLYFRDHFEIMRIPVRTAPSFTVTGTPEIVLNAQTVLRFDLSPDGESLYLVGRNPTVQKGKPTPLSFTWIQNWSLYLKSRFDE